MFKNSLIRNIRRNKPADKPLLSVIVIVYNMQREAYRTLISLSNKYQHNIDSEDYEIILVDNGSDQPFQFEAEQHFDNYRYFHLDTPPPSPAYALNFGIDKAKGKYLGLMIDGARMVTPGLLSLALKALESNNSPLVCVPGLHLGPEHQGISVTKGYSKEVEDQLLDYVNWHDNGYNLFKISCWAGSSKGGWLANIAESNCIFLEKSQCIKLGGFDESFELPGGGFVNLDFYKRASTNPDANVVHIQGEGCFHQLHGGVTTGGNNSSTLAEELHDEYRRIRGADYTVPEIPFTILGHAPLQSIPSTLDACRYILGMEPSASWKSDKSIAPWLHEIGLDDIDIPQLSDAH